MGSEPPPAEREASGNPLEGGVCKVLHFKSEFRNSKSETISNTLNSNAQNKKLITVLSYVDASGYMFQTSLVLNVGNSDFGFVSYFVFRASNVLGFLAGTVEPLRFARAEPEV